MSRSRTKMLVVTLLPASRQMRAAALSSANSRLPNTPARSARCAVVAKGVKETATPAEATGEGKGKTKAPQQEHTKKLGLQAGECSAGRCRESHRTRSALDLMSARSPSDSAGINCNFLNCSSTREEASCCHPISELLARNNLAP